MTLGPRSMIRCQNIPTFVAVEKVRDQNNQVGAMTLCAECRQVLDKLYPDRATVYRIIRVKGKEQ
jgi:hypothetical protein